MKIVYFKHLIKTIPLLPVIYFEGRKIKREIPTLPEARIPEGFVNINTNQDLTVLFIGESSFAGVGSEFHKNSFAGYFARELSALYCCNINWKVYAKTGYNIEKINRRILPKITDLSCDLLVIGIGGNDTFELTSPKNWTKNIQVLIDRLQQKFPKKPILFVQLPTIESFPAFTKTMKFVLGNHKNLLADYLVQLMLKNENVYYPAEKINVKEWMKSLKENQTISEFFSDGIHPSELTYDLWAKDSARFLLTSNLSFTK